MTAPARCPSCGDRLLGFTPSDYREHLRRDHGPLAARIVSSMVDPEASADGGDGR